MLRRLLVPFLLLALPLPATAADFALEQFRGYPFPNELTAADSAARFALAIDVEGRRNIWAAEGPGFELKQLTQFNIDDGQELSAVTMSSKGDYVVFVRGGDYGSNWDASLPVNVLSLPTPPKVQLWTVPFAGGEAKVLADNADSPAISPRGDVVAFLKEGKVWSAPLDGSTPAEPIIVTRSPGSLAWSPDGSRLAFVSSRGDHAFVGIYTDATTPIQWIDPSTARDATPRWSPDGKSLAFVRRPGSGSDPAIKKVPAAPWTIRIADLATGTSREIWAASTVQRGGIPTGGTNLHWAAGDRIVFLSYEDGWPHLYSVPAAGGEKLLLTPGDYMVEQIKLSPDRTYLLAAANTGPESQDIDRRHLLKIPVDKAEPQVLTPGDGLEWTPASLGDGKSIVCLSATGQRPPLPTLLPIEGGTPKLLGESLLSEYPVSELVTPTQVIFKSPDGLEIHGQLFSKSGLEGKRPAVVYVHGGPKRQMLLGWHYSSYYSNGYALNQYLASRGYIVLAINYRLGIGYGYSFENAAKAGSNGASEYADIKAGGEFLKTLPNVDPARIGIYGGSYGGFLTALGLGHDSDLFAAGVDIHGVHRQRNATENAKPDDTSSGAVAWRSSPVSTIETWKSPVLLISGDDDRNVNVSQTVDLAGRLAAAGIPYELILIPDDTHHFMRSANWLRVGKATVDFFDRHIGEKALVKEAVTADETSE